MAFHDISYPTELHPGTAIGSSFRVSVVESDSQQEERGARVSKDRSIFEITYGQGNILTDFSPLQTFYRCRKGPENTFRFESPMDYTSNQDGQAEETNLDQIIGTGDGSTTQFQLVKTYEDDEGYQYVRNVTLPQDGTVTVAINGANQASGWSVSTTTGIVTFTAAPASGTITAGYRHDYRVRFDGSGDASSVFIDTTSGIAAEARTVRLIEVPTETAVQERYNAGGSTNFGTITEDITISLSDGLTIVVDDDTGVDTNLPNPTTANLPDGRLWTIINDGSSNHEVRDDEDNLVKTLGTGATVELHLVLSDAGVYSWKAVG